MPPLMKHLWHAVGKWRYRNEIAGLALCNKPLRFDSGDIVLDPTAVTCPVCLERYGQRPALEAAPEPTPEPVLTPDQVSMLDAQTVKGQDLVDAYNRLAESLGRSPVQRFRSLRDGRDQVKRALRAARDKDRQ